ncbi:MAG: peptidyl-tRNA hydrolase, family [Actinomycetota bacterium]|jgi:PTH1 family peptidyl-tRNA hydrolase|nr:peptidyl-tRNA hydrolase, family [Actinomycetota bacterium]
MASELLVVGLGNPGTDYAGTRHNVGADVVVLLAARHGGKLRPMKKERALADEVTIGGTRVALAFPTTFMNDSGFAVAALLRRHDIDDPARLVVVHDELDLPQATVRVKAGGGLAGHNGLRSIVDHVKTNDFLRVRIGIGKPPGGKEQGADHVLRRPPKTVKQELAIAIEEAADAVELIVAEGVDRAMNRYNTPAPTV